MKNLFFLSFFVFAFASHMNAQFGVKGGINLASLQQEGIEADLENIQDGTILGFQLGAMYRLSLTDNLKLQPEVLYIQKGGKQDYEVVAIDRQTEVQTFYNYLEVPVMLQYYFGEEATGFMVEGGLFAGLAMSGKNEVTTVLMGETSEATTEFNFDDQDNQKRLDYGVSFGLGYALNNLTFNLRYNFGINNLLDDDANNTNDLDPKLSTRGLSGTVGYYF